VKPVHAGQEVARLSARREGESEARYRMLFEHTSDAVVVFNEEGRFLEVNENFCRLLGYGREELLRMNVLDLLPGDELARQPVSYEDLRAGKTVRRERPLLRKDGTRVRVEVVGSMVAEGTMQSVLKELPREAAEMVEGGRVEFYEEVRRFEMGLIRRALARTGGNQKAAAALLGVNHTTLHTMTRRYGIAPSEFKPAPVPRLIRAPHPRPK
jgi:PAS domain S-box-containing protein